MQSSRDEASAIHRMISALEELMTLRDPAHKVSNGAKIVERLKQLQDAYHSLDSDAKKIINIHLQAHHPRLFHALEKKGSKISKPFELAGEIHDSLPAELKKIIAANPALAEMKTTAIPSFEEAEDAFVMPDTIRVNTDVNDDEQLSGALAKANLQLDPNVYAFFGAAVDPLTAVIDALEILLKTKIQKDKIFRGEPKPNGFDNAYREALLQQIQVLNKHKPVLAKINLDGPDQEKLTAIKGKVTSSTADTVPDLLRLAGSISLFIDDSLIKSLRETLRKHQPDTPRYFK